jgi:hypothetical protein
MKNKQWYFILIGLMILTSLSIFAQTKKLRDIGRYKFIPVKAGTLAPEVMKVIAEKYADDIKRGFDLAGYPSLYPPFIDRIRQSAFTERELAVGSKMMWMIFRAQGQIQVVQDLEWAGQEPLPVLSFSIQEGDKKYELIMPKACGNIALEKVESAAGLAEEQKPPKPVPPVLPLQEKPEEQYDISKAKIYQEFGDLINEADLYCSFSVWEEEIPGLKIIGAARESEKTMFSDSDVIYLNKGNNGDVKPGQIFWVLEIRDELPGYGPMAFGKGRARVQFADNGTTVAVVEHTCDAVRTGYYLVPFEDKKGVTGKDLGYDVPPVEADGVKGNLIYLQNNLQQIATNHWALIDLGAEQGIKVGQQMILYRWTGKDLPVQILGNCIVIDVKSTTSTIKVLSCRDVFRKGDRVMERPPQ